MSESSSDFPREQVLFLVRAQSRVQVLDVLSIEETLTQQHLRDRVDASRTTVSRSLQSLSHQGWVTETSGGYRLTRAGQHIATVLHRLLDTVERVDALGEFLRWFPPDVSGPNFLTASDVTVTYSTDAAPYAPARKQSEILHTADRLRVLLPAVDMESTETLVEQVIERGLDIETTVSPAVESVLESEEFAPRVREMTRAGGLSIRVADDGVPFYLGLSDAGTVQIGLASDDGLPRALLETTDEQVYAWAETLYSDVRGRNESKTLNDF